MKNVTDFGKALKKLRIDYCELLGTMAGKLDISPAYLSSIESGERNIPEDLIPKLCQIYPITEEQKKEFYLLRAKTHGYTTIKFGENDSQKAIQTVFLLAQDFPAYTDTQIEQLKTLLDAFHNSN